MPFGNGQRPAFCHKVVSNRRLAEDRDRAQPSMMMIHDALAPVLALGLLAAPLVTQTQPATKVWRIGYLGYAHLLT